MTATRAETRENDTPKASQEVEAGLEQQDRDDEKDGHGRSTADSAVTAAGHGSQPATGPTVTSATLGTQEHFPSLATDVERYGEPFQYWPFPCWRKWKVEVWWYFDGSARGTIFSLYGKGWTCEHIFWMNSLEELSAIHRIMYKTAGLYNRLHLELSSWVWDYAEPFWQEEEHL